VKRSYQLGLKCPKSNDSSFIPRKGVEKMRNNRFKKGECIYANPLATPDDLKDFISEGEVKTTFENGWLILENGLEAEATDDKGHWVLWCPTEMPDEIIIEWEFSPLREPGLCMIFFAATGKNGEDLFDPTLPKRTGLYPQYHSGEINALHLSYFRRKWEEERQFCTCNLRKSHGFHLVAMGADPIPTVRDAKTYQMQIVKHQDMVQFSINDLTVLEWQDPGTAYGPILGKGKIGFRQMAPMKGSYRNLTVHQAVLEREEK